MKKWIEKNLKGDIVIWNIVFILSIISILLVYSATSTLAYRKLKGNTEYYLLKHTITISISIITMWFIHNINYRVYTKISKLILWISTILLLFTWQKGANINSASRWLHIPMLGNTSFQPSDLAQFSLVVYLASILSRKNYSIQKIQQMFAWSIIICTLIALTNLSSAIILFITCVVIMYIGMLEIKNILIFILLGVIGGTAALAIGQRGKTAVSRMKIFSEKELPFQTQQSCIAIAEGGLYGKGPGKSIQRNFLPHPYSDFIYSILIEEYGLIGGVFVIILYIIFLYRSINTINKNNDIFGSILATGLSTTLVLQAMINMAVAVGIAPVTGINLPLISMGGTSMLFTGISIGIILSISKESIKKSY